LGFTQLDYGWSFFASHPSPVGYLTKHLLGGWMVTSKLTYFEALLLVWPTLYNVQGGP